MSRKDANKMIGRIRRTTEKGKGFTALMSDLMRMIVAGEISLEEGKAVQRVADEQLRKFDKDLRKERAALLR